MLDTTANTDNAAADTDDEDVKHCADMRIYTVGDYVRLRDSGGAIMAYCGAFLPYRKKCRKLPPCTTCYHEHEMWRQSE